MLLSFPQLSTERLLLRQLKIEDATQIFLLRSDETVNRFIDRQRATSIEDAFEFIHKINTAINNNESMYWGITTADDATLIGTICLWNIIPEKETAEIGYELLPTFHGKGFMQEAIVKVIDHVFEAAGFKTIEAVPRADNERSVKLLEKNKFKRDREAEKRFTDEERAEN
ncbi:MAG TPA: GNAT family N-acetyltransferase, partial [Ferruginibacter sp.]|nr:GNAT family N-acetyltransferase [Ferruginibacter sp.]